MAENYADDYVDYICDHEIESTTEDDFIAGFKKGIEYAKEIANKFFKIHFSDNDGFISSTNEIRSHFWNVAEMSNTFNNLLEIDELGKELKNVTKTITLEYYLELLVTISLRFIQGKFIESYGLVMMLEATTWKNIIQDNVSKKNFPKTKFGLLGI